MFRADGAKRKDTMLPCARPVAGFLGWLHAVMLFDRRNPRLRSKQLLGRRLEQDRQSSRLTASARPMSMASFESSSLRVETVCKGSACFLAHQSVPMYLWVLVLREHG